MAYNRILLPVDGSEHSMHAVAHAVSLVREGGEIVVATVLPPIPNVIGGDARKEAEEAVKTDASLITQPVMDVIAKDNIACREKIVLHTSTAEGIIETAEDMKCDLIVMGSRGRSDIEGLLLGSVTHTRCLPSPPSPCSSYGKKLPVRYRTNRLGRRAFLEKGSPSPARQPLPLPRSPAAKAARKKLLRRRPMQGRKACRISSPTADSE